MELATQQIFGTTYKTSVGEIALTAGQWLWVYSGPILNPATDLETQVPTGKKWTVRISVEVFETPV
jgi:hypothetical protein